MENTTHNNDVAAPNFNQFEKYKKTAAILRTFQLPCTCIASFCLSFFVFARIFFHVLLPKALFITFIVLGCVCLVGTFVLGRVEKKLYQRSLNVLSFNTQNALIKAKEERKQ